MGRTDIDFPDGVALDFFSPEAHSFVITKKSPPSAPATSVQGSTGEPWVALYNYSWVITVNDTVFDLVGAKFEALYDPVQLASVGITDDNTYVGQLSSDGKSWIIDDGGRNVYRQVDYALSYS
jgi:hypothetical protein